MAGNLESSHAKNVANFESLISAINGLGAIYNPSKSSLAVGELTKLSKSADDTVNQVNYALGRYKLAVAARAKAFSPLSKLSTRIINALRASDTKQQVDDVAKSLVRKIQGQRATPKLSEEKKATLLAEGKVKKEVSSSQMGFDNRIDSLDKLIQLLGAISQYSPNEVELQLSTLETYYHTLKTTNNDVRELETQLSNARLLRNEILYKPNTGLVDTAIAVKMYLKSVFGTNNPKYKQISGLKFRVNLANKIPEEETIVQEVPVR